MVVGCRKYAENRSEEAGYGLVTNRCVKTENRNYVSEIVKEEELGLQDFAVREDVPLNRGNSKAFEYQRSYRKRR